MQADPDEISKFASMAEQWWDPDGPVAPLHKLNPVRLAWIRDQLITLQVAETPPLRPLKDLRILDVGCGAGLASEPMAAMGADVTGIDLAASSVDAARAHARGRGIQVDYRVAGIETMVDQGDLFDAVTMLEVIEHVPEQQDFVTMAAACVRPGGHLIVSTIAKSLEAYLKAIVGAEYLLGWLPPGTHSWRQFVKPSAMARMIRSAGLEVTSITGVSFDPSHGRFALCRDPSVNYMMAAVRRS